MSEFDVLSGIDVHEGLSRMNNSISDYQNFLCMFSITCEECHKTLNQALDDSDVNLARQQVHKLRGAAINLGASSLAVACAEFLENAPTDKDYPAKGLLQNVFVNLEDVMQGLSEYTASHNIRPNKEILFSSS